MENLLRIAGNDSNRATGFNVHVVGSVPSQPQVSLSVEQTAQQLGLTSRDILRLISRGELAGINIEGKWHIDDADLKAVMKTSRRWRVPADLGVVDYASERKVRERLLTACQVETPDGVILAAAKRAVRPGMPLESVAVVEMPFTSAPRSFVEALAADSRRGEFQPTIKGEQAPAPVSLGFAFCKSRLMAALSRFESRELNVKGSLAGYMYSSPEAYRQVVAFAVDKVQNELMSVRETRLVELEQKRIELGSEVQISVRRIPVTVVYTLPTSAVDSVLRINRTANEAF
jgi:hypothetical protein